MNFSDPSKVDEVVRRMQETSWSGDENMARINDLFNGNPPWTRQEAKKYKVQINVPSMKCPAIMDNARGQWETAFTSRDKYWRARCLEGPPEMRFHWGQVFTSELARITKRSKAFLSTIVNVGASTMLHGRGPMNWADDDHWCPDMIGLGDVKIPALTYADFSNLPYTGLYRRYTPFTLYDSAFGKTPDKRWNTGMVKRIIAALNEVNMEVPNWSTWEFPAEIVEDMKAQSGYWSSDAVPQINAWDFYYKLDEGRGIGRKMILDRNMTVKGKKPFKNSQDWLYEGGDEPFAKDWTEVLQVMYANGCHVAPFRYHSVRGLGYRLFEDGRYEARANNRFRESVLQEMMWVFYNVPAEERERVESFWLSHIGVLPQGVKWVPANERYRMDLGIVEAGLNGVNQSMGESSTSYVMDTATGGESDRETATRTMARMQQSNAMIGNFLNKAYEQFKYVGIEVVRRLLKRNSTDPDADEFREGCVRGGIPDELLKPEFWLIDAERVAGNGNRILAAAMADRLMLQYNRFDPQGQRVALRMYVEANADDPTMGEAIVPMQDKEPSQTVVRAYEDVGALMQGLSAPMTRSENQIEYVETLLKAMGELVGRVDQSGGMADEKTVVGLATMGQEIQRRIELIGQDPGEKSRVKEYGDALGRLMNMVKAFAQRLQQAAQKRGQQMDPAVMAKLQGTMLLAQTNAKIKEGAAVQRMKHRELQLRQKMAMDAASFVGEERRKDMEAGMDARRKILDATASTHALDLTTAASIRNGARKALSSMEE